MTPSIEVASCPKSPLEVHESSLSQDEEEAGDSPTPKEYIYTPGRHDVLLGRGGGTNNHAGNIQFRKLINEHKLRYLASSKVEKPKVARQVVEIWQGLSPRGRFLSRVDEKNKGPHSVWYEVGPKKAREKASQCLRERTPEVMPYIKQLREQQDAMTEQGVSLVPQKLQGLQKDPDESLFEKQQNHLHSSPLSRRPSLSMSNNGSDHLRSPFNDFSNPLVSNTFNDPFSSMSNHHHHHHHHQQQQGAFLDDPLYSEMSEMEYQQKMMIMQQQLQMQQLELQRMQQQRALQRQAALSTATPAAGSSYAHQQYEMEAMHGADPLLSTPLDASFNQRVARVTPASGCFPPQRNRNTDKGNSQQKTATTTQAVQPQQSQQQRKTPKRTLSNKEKPETSKPEIPVSTAGVTALNGVFEEGELTLDQYRIELERYMEQNPGGDDDHSDLEDDWEKEREKAMKDRKRGVDRNVSGISFMSTNTTKTNVMSVSGLSGLTDLLKDGNNNNTNHSRQRQVSRNISGDISLMSELTDLSDNMDQLSLYGDQL